jgi:choline-sulfatase
MTVARRVSETVSLLNMLPTFADIGGALDQVLKMKGCSLVPALTGDPIKDRTVPAEFLAEGVFDPTFLLITDRLKLLYSEIDPPLLFDLAIDPNELTNQAQNPVYQNELAEMLSLARDSWDAEALKRQIIADQNRRRLIQKAHQIGAPPVWDFQPYTDASQQYVRAGK